MERLTLTVDEGHVADVEHDLAPPMAAAITLPIQGLKHQGITLYVAASPFAGLAPPNAELTHIAIEIARRIASSMARKKSAR